MLTLFDDPRDHRRPAINVAAFDSATVHRLDDDSSITHMHRGW